jgi:hypothetical protein
MQRFLQIILLALFLPAITMAAKYDGTFLLKEAIGEDSEAVEIPAGHFNLVLRSEDDTNYDMSMRVGNVLRARVKVTQSNEAGADGLRVGPVMSTMMMPPEKLFHLEQFLSSNLPKMTTMQLDDTTLTVEGDSPAKAVFEKQEE